MHVMKREDFERQAAREVNAAQVADALIASAGLKPVYTEQIAGRTVTFNTIQLSESPDFKGEAQRRRTMTIAGIGKQASGNDEVRRQLGPTGKEWTR